MNNIYKTKNIVHYIFFTEKEETKFEFFRFRSDPDPLLYDTDPRIRIQIKMKRIRNNASKIGS